MLYLIILQLTEFEPRTSGVGSDISANWATTTIGLTICYDTTEIPPMHIANCLRLFHLSWLMFLIVAEPFSLIMQVWKRVPQTTALIIILIPLNLLNLNGVQQMIPFTNPTFGVSTKRYNFSSHLKRLPFDSR